MHAVFHTRCLTLNRMGTNLFRVINKIEILKVIYLKKCSIKKSEGNVLNISTLLPRKIKQRRIAIRMTKKGNFFASCIIEYAIKTI